jgi:hypothetical protein
MTLAQSEPKIVYKIAPEAQAIFFRRRHQAKRLPPAKIRPSSPAPAMGPGTDATGVIVMVSPIKISLASEEPF